MKSLGTRMFGLLVGLVVVAAIGATTSRDARAVIPPLPNTVQQWNKIAEDTVVGSGAFQGEGEIYISYASAGFTTRSSPFEEASSPMDRRSPHCRELPSIAQSSRPRIGRCGITSRHSRRW